MQKRQSQENDLVPEPIFAKTAAECFLIFEKYRLKTHIVGSNIDKDIIWQCYDSLEGRITERYTKIYEHLKREIENLQKNFILAKASNLRTLNNILRNYRRRVGTIANEPLSNFKYNKFDKYQKVLLESLVYNERQNYHQILQFKEELTISMEQGDKQISDRYRPNQKIKESYKKMLEVVDKTECYCYKYYENFERSMNTTINNLQSYFEKLNVFLTVWENVGSTKAYEAKSQKEKEMEQKGQDGLYNRRYFQEETEQHLQELYNNCPPHSSQKQQYRKRLNDLRKYIAEKQKKMDMVGKMFNKRKARAGILVSRYRDLSVVDWYFNIEGNRTGILYLDQFKHYNAEIENTQNEFKPTGYQLQKPFKKDRIDDIKQHMLRYQNKSQLNHQWRYDKFGKDGVFDLIDCGSQLVQKRIEFQISRQVQLQNSDDRRKRQLLEKQNLHTREIQRKEGLHIGYLHFQENQEMEWLQNREYDTQYLPQILKEGDQSDSIQLTDQQNDEIQNDQIDFEVPKQIKKEATVGPQKKQPQKQMQMIQLIKLGNQKQQKLAPFLHKQYQKQQIDEQQSDKDFQEMDLEEQIITSFFKEYSLKVLRKQSEPMYKQTKFLYFQTIEDIRWQKVARYFECEKIFVSTKNTIIYLNHIFSKQEKIKGSIYTLDPQMQSQTLKQRITQCFTNLALVTIKMYPIYTQLEEQSVSSFMIGLLLILLKQNEMPEEYENKHYIQAGKQIIEDYNCYYYPEQYKTSLGIYMRHKQNSGLQQSARNKRQSSILSQSDSISHQGTSISSKNETAVSFSYKQQNKRQMQENEQLYQRKNVQAMNRSQNPVYATTYQSYRQQKVLKRQNSREYLGNAQLEVPVIINQQRQVQNDDKEQQDYESL